MYDLRPHRQVHRCAATCPPCACLTRFVPAMLCAVPGGPNRPHRGAIPPVPPGPLYCPNCTQPTIPGLTVAAFQQVRPRPLTAAVCRRWHAARRYAHAARAQALGAFFELLPQATSAGNRPHGTLPPPAPRRAVRIPPACGAGQPVPAELSNLDQLKVVYDTLPDYFADDPQPSCEPAPSRPCAAPNPSSVYRPRPLAARRRARCAVSADRARARRRPPCAPFLGLRRLDRDQRRDRRRDPTERTTRRSANGGRQLSMRGGFQP